MTKLLKKIFNFGCTEDLVKEFVDTFPNKCMICSYHQFGRSEGLTKEVNPKEHYCIEKENNE